MYLLDSEMKTAQKNCKKFKFFEVADKEMVVAVVAWLKGFTGKEFECCGSRMYYNFDKNNEAYVVKEFVLREQGCEHSYTTIKATPFTCEIKDDNITENLTKNIKKKRLISSKLCFFT